MSDWRKDVAIVESLKRRIEEFKDNPARRVVYETALNQMLAGNAYLRTVSAPETIA